jgi:hypothetical protein
MKIKKYILPLFAVLYLCSCDKYLDVDPDNRATVDNKTKIAALLVSAYPSYTHCYLTEMASDNVDRMDRYTQWGDRQQGEFFFWQDASEVGTDSPHSFWEGCYKAIASANQALAAIEEIGNDDGSLNAQKAEALLCRAYGHFLLVNVFCMHYSSSREDDLGIHYMKEVETTVKPIYRRGTVAEVYAQIETDIEEALPLVSDEGFSTPKYHFNRKAAHAFAARFFLYYQKYDRVISCATETLGSDPSLSLRDWAHAGRTTTYDIRGNEFIDSENRANLLLIPKYSLWGVYDGPYYNGAYYLHHSDISEQETDASAGPWGDGRVFRFGNINLMIQKVCNYKMMAFFEYTDPVQRIGYYHIVYPAFTTDETLLCRAEAHVMNKDYDAAVRDLAIFMRNYSTGRILTRQNINEFYKEPETETGPGTKYYEYNAATPKKRLNPDFEIEPGEQENLIHCVLHIRRILTRSEGLRWFDVKRYGIEIYRRAITVDFQINLLDVLPVNDPRRAIQLPMDVINAGLPANPRDINVTL